MADPARLPAPLTRAAIEQIQAKAEKATPGPWAADLDWREGGADQVVYEKNGRHLTLCFLATGREEDDVDRDAEYLAACDPQTIHALCVLALRGLELDEGSQLYRLQETSVAELLAEQEAEDKAR